MLKVRDAFFTALFGVVCIVTIFTHGRPPSSTSAATSRPVRSGKGVGLRQAPRGAHRPPHLPRPLGGLGHRAGCRGIDAPGPGRRAVDGNLPRDLPLHHGIGHRYFVRLHRVLQRRAQLAATVAGDVATGRTTAQPLPGDGTSGLPPPEAHLYPRPPEPAPAAGGTSEGSTMADEVLRERRGTSNPHHQPARGSQRHQRRREHGDGGLWTSWPRTRTAGSW